MAQISQFRQDVNAAFKKIGIKQNYHYSHHDLYKSGSRRIKLCGQKTTKSQRAALLDELSKKYGFIIIKETYTKRMTGMYYASPYHQGLSILVKAQNVKK